MARKADAHAAHARKVEAEEQDSRDRAVLLEKVRAGIIRAMEDGDPLKAWNILCHPTHYLGTISDTTATECARLERWARSRFGDAFERPAFTRFAVTADRQASAKARDANTRWDHPTKRRWAHVNGPRS